MQRRLTVGLLRIEPVGPFKRDFDCLMCVPSSLEANENINTGYEDSRELVEGVLGTYWT